MFRIRAICLFSFAVHDLVAQTITTSPPPAEIVFVSNPYGYFLTKHPKLPMLYLGCYVAPEAKNLVTLQLAADGAVNTNSLRSFNYFSENPTNELWRYLVQKPIVLPEEKILYLAAVPSYHHFFAHTNHQEIAAIALDDEGQPGKILRAIRTSHGEKEIRGWQFEPTTRRLYMSYHSYFGWIPIGKDGLAESDKFNLLAAVQTCWQWVYVPAWQRFYARQTDSGLVVFKLTGDGSTPDLVQIVGGPYRGVNNLGLSQTFGKIYFLDTLGSRLAIYQFNREGRLTGVPRFFPTGDASGVRCDFKSKRLYSWNNKSVLKSYPLDERGTPLDPPEIFPLHCGAIRDVLVDEASGKIYVACTEPPSPGK